MVLPAVSRARAKRARVGNRRSKANRVKVAKVVASLVLEVALSKELVSPRETRK